MASSLAERIDFAPFLFDHPTVRQDIERTLAADLPWHRLNDKTILVTGAAGMLPAAMVDVLMSALLGSKRIRLKVIALVRSWKRAELRFGHWLGAEGFSLVTHDMMEPLRTADRPQMIIHAASQASPKFFGSDPVGTVLPNVLGTANLLDLARHASTERFLFFSSAEVYGNFVTGPPSLDEKTYGSIDPLANRSCYAESKRMGETLCAAYAHQYDVPAMIVRPFHTYGPGMRLDDGRVFADFIRDVVSGHDIILKSSGAAQRSFCYLADATEAYLRILLTGQPGEAYNVGNPSASTSMYDLATLLMELFPQVGLQGRQTLGASQNGTPVNQAATMLPDITRANALGWLPATGLAQGFQRTIKYYMAVGDNVLRDG